MHGAVLLDARGDVVRPALIWCDQRTEAQCNELRQMFGASRSPAVRRFNQQGFYVDIFNRGKSPFTFTAAANIPWVRASEPQGKVAQAKRIWISVDWNRTPRGLASGSLEVSSNSGQNVTVKVDAFRRASPSSQKLEGFIDAEGYVSMEAVHYTKKIDGATARWEKIDDLGRTLSSMTVFPVTADSFLPGQQAPCLEYKMYLSHSGAVTVEAILDPTLNLVPGCGLRHAVFFDAETPQKIDILAHNDDKEAWGTSVKDSVRKSRSVYNLAHPGYHTLKIWMVDPGVVLLKLVVDLGGVKPSYLGPPESYHIIHSNKTLP